MGDGRSRGRGGSAPRAGPGGLRRPGARLATPRSLRQHRRQPGRSGLFPLAAGSPPPAASPRTPAAAFAPFWPPPRLTAERHPSAEPSNNSKQRLEGFLRVLLNILHQHLVLPLLLITHTNLLKNVFYRKNTSKTKAKQGRYHTHLWTTCTSAKDSFYLTGTRAEARNTLGTGDAPAVAQH